MLLKWKLIAGLRNSVVLVRVQQRTDLRELCRLYAVEYMMLPNL
jgi:hypothetical protein